MDYTKLKELREKTGVSFSLCKKALEESKNDLKKAEKLLNEWGAKKAAEKSERSTSQGGLFSYVHHNKKVAAMVELQCETDFVSGNEEFKKLGAEFAMQAATVQAKDVEELLKTEYIREAGKTMNDLLKEAVLKFGENTKVARFSKWVLGEADTK
ncbi:MAG: elongation factor Ts [Patescibacteria group bacterium]